MAFLEFNRFEVDHDGFGAFSPTRCVTDRRYKLAVNLTDKDELYDLENDPYEMDNLIDADAHSAARDELHGEIIDWMNRTRDPFRDLNGSIVNGTKILRVVGEALRGRGRKTASIRIPCCTILRTD